MSATVETARRLATLAESGELDLRALSDAEIRIAASYPGMPEAVRLAAFEERERRGLAVG